MRTDRRVAVDTTVMVNYLTGGEISEQDAPRFRHSRWVIEKAKAGDFQLIVPAIVIAEVAGCPRVRGSEVPEDERTERIEVVRQWIHASDFLVADVDDRVVRLAAGLAIEHQLSGADACVLAAAITARCDTLFSWDKAHYKLGERLPGIVVRKPQETERLQTHLDVVPRT